MTSIVLGLLSGMCVFSSLLFCNIDFSETDPAYARIHSTEATSYKSVEQGPR